VRSAFAAARSAGSSVTKDRHGEAENLSQRPGSPIRNPQSAIRNAQSAIRNLLALALLLIATAASRAEVELPLTGDSRPIAIRANSATHWTQGAYEVWVLRGDCRIEQGLTAARAGEAVLWIDRAESFSGRPSRVIAYLEGNVEVDFGRPGDTHAGTGKAAQSVRDRTWLGRFQTTAGIEMAVPLTAARPGPEPGIVERGLAARDPADATAVQPAQFSREEIAPPAGTPIASSGNRVRVLPRGGGRIGSIRVDADDARGETVVTVNQGVQIVVEGIDLLGTVSVETDRLVFWAPQQQAGGGNFAEALQSGDGPLEFYMEGNIIFRQGDRVIYADRMYYNVQQERGVVLNAEMLTPVAEYQGLLRLKADVLQQVNRQHFEAYGAAVTSSRIGVPRYWFQTQNVAIDDIQTPLIDPFTNTPLLNPQTGEPEVQHQILATSRNNYLYLLGSPIFYWPVIATDLTKPTFYLDRIRLKNDGVFGSQVLLDWDLYQLLGVENPAPNSKWTLSTDYLSDRGPALGTNYFYEGDTLFGMPGPYRGFIDAWGIHDDGRDNLGRDWRDLAVPDPWRGRLLGQHRQYLPGDFILSAELGLASDYNFLEQYYELEWDTLKDQSTDVELKRLVENASWSLLAEARPNSFVTDTEWLRGDHFLIGQSLMFDRLTWHEHTSIGYARMRRADAPVDPAQLAVFSFLPWEADVEGLRAATRHELDLPLQVGPTKIVPYVLGEAAHWGQDLTGEELSRTYVQGGVKASLPVWRADPQVSSELFNLNGMAHKITYEVEAFYAAADQDLGNLPLYDPLDDNATEWFRRQEAVRTFGQAPGTFVPMRYDERYFALRSNLQGSVTGQTEIADDLTEIRMGINQRWQTKRGLVGQERIIDWIVLDVGAVAFPDPNRDNFGEGLGLIDYEAQWHVGDRLTLLSDGFYDVFSDGLKQTTVGGIINRPEHGQLYLGYRSTQGPISSSIVAGSVSYRMSEKWIGTAGASWDLGPTGNIGQNIAITRIGESFLLKIGFSYDASRDNLGVSFGLEPRFLSSSRLGRVGGVQVPPAGAMGLE
jgi:hypothetical protein